MRNSFSFSYREFKWELKLTDEIVVIDCNSGAGKTLMMDSLEELSVLPEFNFVRVFNYKTRDLAKQIKSCENNLIFIDNGELMLDNDVVHAIYYDLTNQFVIAAHNLHGLEVSLNDFKKLVYDEHQKLFRLEDAYAKLFSMA